jgi:5-methyltetrahydrofolate--homocysteine methyltransferase
MLESAGFEVLDLGVDVFPEKFVEAIESLNPQILALSCLLTTTMESMHMTVEKVREARLRDRVKVIIGGPPTSDAFAKKIGADFYRKDAYVGIEMARKVVSN